MASLLNMSGGSLLKKGLPYDAEIEYLESTGTQYIETGISPTNTTVSEIKAFSGQNVCYYLGAGDVDGADQIYGIIKYLAGSFQFRYYGRVNFSGSNTQPIVFKIDNGDFYSDGELVGSKNRIFSINATLVLFAVNINNLTINKYKCRIYWFKASDANIAVDLIPVRVGNVGYMYDKVSGQLFGNSGTGNFILGPDK